ncbi:transposase, partial [Mycobacterium sp. ACS4331]|uniref:transposase n=1 Tax=Mycobacterium sp. ACS4331 TaxID=1834121 RepID=UPI000A82A571
MPRPYPAEFRARAIALVRAGKPQKQTAEDLGIHPVTSSKWIKQTAESPAMDAAPVSPSRTRHPDPTGRSYRRPSRTERSTPGL